MSSHSLKSKRPLNVIYSNGVEITSSIEFSGWHPGFEYTKNLNFKNLNTKTVKLNYLIPKTKTFTTLFPKQISLSPGTTFSLPITFRPLNKVNYFDELELHQVDFDTKLSIKLVAKLPQFKLDIQESLNLGCACVNESISSELVINNKSDLDTYFEWDVKEPFSVMPSSGEIKAHASFSVVFSFLPSAALVYESNVICKYGSDATSSLFRVLKLSATSKYPHLLIENGYEASSEIVLTFDKCFMGQNLTKYFTIINMTEVNTSFTIERNPNVPLFDRCFNCLQYMGTLKPFEQQKIPITYSANYPSSDQIFDYFDIYTVGKLSKNTVTCVAKNEMTKVTIENNLINFGLCQLKSKILKTFQLKNHSQCSVEFQFETDNESCSFIFNQTSGILQANESKLIQVLFMPQHPIIYYKKITCILNNHNPLFVELIGTCHSELMKPAEINKKHIDLYYSLRKNGFLSHSPEQLAENTSNQLKNIIKNAETSSREMTSTYSNEYEEFLAAHEDSLIQLDAVYVDFGASQPIQMLDETKNTQEKSISIFNKTKSKIVVYWNSSETQPFKITPQISDIPPMKSCAFRIKFEPTKQDQFYKFKLEGYAIYKSLTDYTLTEPRFIIPPWCLNIDCLGHTFHPSSETFFLPKCYIDTEHVIFPVSIKDKPVYRNLMLKNNSSDTPLVYDFRNTPISEFLVKPLKGMIKKNDHQIFVFKFTPKIDSYIVEKLEIALNYMNKHVLEIGVVGGAVMPIVSLENNGILYFQPTCKNNNSFQLYEVANLTRHALNYEWKLPYEAKNLFNVEEPVSVLLPYEKKKFTWRFSPEKLEKFNQKMTLVTWIDESQHINNKISNTKIYPLRVLGSCTSGSLHGLEMYKDFGNIIVGSSISSELVIINNNDCNMDFELFLKQTTDDVNKVFNNVCILELEKYTANVKARSRCVIRCRVRPTKLISYQFTVEYRIIYPNEKKVESGQDEVKSERASDILNKNIEEHETIENNNKTATSVNTNNNNTNNNNKREVLCYMTANGVYPKLNITDIKATGAASNLSKDFLWKLLSIKELNTSMGCEPNPEELIYSIATRQEANRRPASQTTKNFIDLNFNAAPLNSDDTQVVLFVENSGLVATDWVLLFPKDLLLELEYWAQNGDYDIEELEEMKVQDNKLFTIEPKKGHLEPGEMVRIKMVYKHLFTGQNRLPVMLKIAKGREIMLNLIGTTVARNEPFVFFPSSKFEMEPVDIGLAEYPIQIYELFNGGDIGAEVEIDYSLIDQLNEENYARPILKCLTENVIRIPPGSCFETKWKFSPIEAKTYEVDILFKVNKVHFTAITFKCIGYDKRKMNNAIMDNRIKEIPEKQMFTLPNQLAMLSMDRVVLGDIPLFTRERKIIFVKNNSSEHRISFTWHVTNPDHIRYVRIQPSRGMVDANQNKLCKVTFISKDKPAFYNLDLICEIKNETEMEKYREELEQWKFEQTRQFQEFVIEEPELEDRLKGLSKREEIKEANKIRDKHVGSQLAIHKFKTIPPILRSNLLEETNLEKVRRKREEKKQWIKPLPPNPFLLHLNVIARTQHADEFLDMSKKVKNNSEKFIDSLLGIQKGSTFASNSPASIEMDHKDKKISCNEQESQTVDFIFADLLRNLVSDKSFHALVYKLKDEDVPYFFQFSQDITQSEIKAHSSNQSAKQNKPNEKIKTKTKASTKNTQNLKNSPIFSSLIENIFENTISNILTEAFNKEFSLTNRPRLIALPPKLSSPNAATSATNTINNPDSASNNDNNNNFQANGVKSFNNGLTKSNGNFNKSSFFSKTKTGEPSVPISPILSTSELV